MKIAVLWSELPGYAAACVREVASRDAVDVVTVRYAHEGEKPFEAGARLLPCPLHSISAADSSSEQWAQLRGILDDFEPDCCLVSGWAIPVFNRAVRWVKRRGGITVCMVDNQWGGSLQQRLGALYARVCFRRRYSAMFVPGERQRVFARKCGFVGKRVLRGMYGCDGTLFGKACTARQARYGASWPHVFIFVGSLIPRKGIPDLVRAYGAYRKLIDEPWELWLVGEGPLSSLVEGQDGIRTLGFKQPTGCADVLARAGVFVLPSHRESWGVAVQESSIAAMPVICTDQCGSSVHLVSNGYNGYTYEAGDVKHLTELLVRVSLKSDTELKQMGRRSRELAKQFTAERWASNLLEGIESLKPGRR